MQHTRFTAKKVAYMALLTSMALILGYIEKLIPITAAIPGIKLGLSNVVILFGLYMLWAGDAFVLMVLKVVLSGLLFGSPSVMMYSFGGGLLSWIVMTLLSRIKGISIIGVSAAGAVAHNVGQIIVAILVVKTWGLIYSLLPWLMLAAVITGLLTGIVARMVIAALEKSGALKGLRREKSPKAGE